MDINETVRSIKNESAFRFLQITDDAAVFYFIENTAIVKTIALKTGIQTIVSRYFRNKIPTEAEVEYAINFIEDELMSNTELLNKNEALYTGVHGMIDILHLEGKSAETCSRQAIEEAFTQYAPVSMGRSPVYDDISMNKENYAALLIVREILHHLGFEQVTILNGV